MYKTRLPDVIRSPNVFASTSLARQCAPALSISAIKATMAIKLPVDA